MKKLGTTILLGFIISSIFSCSQGSGDPLTGVDVSFVGASITNTNDSDGDGYYSTVTVNWQISSDGEIDLVAYLSYRSANSTGSYTSYKSAAISVTEGTNSGNFSVANSANPISHGIYDFIIEIYEAGDTEDVLASFSSADNAALNDLHLETADEDFLLAVTFVDASIDHFIDPDGDGYNSEARINWTVTTNGAASLTAKIKQRSSTSSGSYTQYKTVTFSPTSSGTSSWYIPIGDSGFRLTHGGYDFSIEVYNTSNLNTVLAERNSVIDNSLDNVNMEQPSEELSISITAAGLTNKSDTDGDGYNHYVLLQWTVSTTAATNVKFRLRSREGSSTGAYATIYKTGTTELVSSGNKSWAIGDAGNELAHGSYDFKIEILDASNNILAKWDAGDDADLNDVNMERANEELWEITLNNTTHTKMDITAGIYGTSTVNPGGYYYRSFTSNPGAIAVTASASGTFSNGDPIGNVLTWSFSVTPTPSYETNLVVTDGWFFLQYQNNGGDDITSLYVNYGTGDQTVDYISLPSNNVNYNIGYYKALSGNEIRGYYGVGAYWYSIEGTQFFYPGGNNQLVHIQLGTAKQGSTKGYDDTPNTYKEQEGGLLRPAEKSTSDTKKYKNVQYNNN